MWYSIQSAFTLQSEPRLEQGQPIAIHDFAHIIIFASVFPNSQHIIFLVSHFTLFYIWTSWSRNKLIECLKKFDVPDKLIRLIALNLIHTTARVKINRDFTEECIVKCGVKQGDPLSATLFRLLTDAVIKQMEVRGNTTKTTYCICRWHSANNKN